jgi:hypothetical protein
MKQTYTPKKNNFLNPLCLIIPCLVAILLPQAAQSQNTNTELADRMYDLYDKADQLYANLPKRNYSGNYLTMAMGISPYGHVQTWRTDEVCDCEGNVVGTKDVSSTRFPFAMTLGLETRLINALSFRVMGSYAQLSKGRGSKVVAENGVFTQMQDDYLLSQLGLHGSVLGHLDNFYVGAGFSRTMTRTSGYKTQLKRGESGFNANETSYYNLKADVLNPLKIDMTPHFFVGYRMMMSPSLFGSIELGVAQSLYFNFQLNIPLSGRVKKSLVDWQEAYSEYRYVKLQALAIDRELNPQKFQSSDCIDIINTSTSSSCPRR